MRGVEAAGRQPSGPEEAQGHRGAGGFLQGGHRKSFSVILTFIAMMCQQHHLPLQYVCLGFSLYNTQQWKKRDRELGDVDLPYCEGLEVSPKATVLDIVQGCSKGSVLPQIVSATQMQRTPAVPLNTAGLDADTQPPSTPASTLFLSLLFDEHSMSPSLICSVVGLVCEGHAPHQIVNQADLSDPYDHSCASFSYQRCPDGMTNLQARQGRRSGPAGASSPAPLAGRTAASIGPPFQKNT